jgi:hypothetical protein
LTQDRVERFAFEALGGIERGHQLTSDGLCCPPGGDDGGGGFLIRAQAGRTIVSVEGLDAELAAQHQVTDETAAVKNS